MNQTLAVASPYRPWAASYRVRVEAWLDRTAIQAAPIAPGRGGRRQDSRRFAMGDVAYEAAIRVRSRKRRGRVLVQKEASRLGTGGLERRLLEHAEMAVYDIDDAVFLPDPRSASTRLGSRAERVAVLLGEADRVVAGNAYLADVASQSCSDVRLIPTCVDLDDYRYTATDRDGARTGVVIGWLGSASTEQYLRPLMPVLADLQRRRDIEIRIIGAGEAAITEAGGCRVVRRPWTLATQAAELAALDIGVAPLPDTPWARGKCGYKLLQYGAAGVAPIGDPVGVAGDILRGAGAPAPSSVSGWSEALDWLVEDVSARERIAERAFEFVKASYTFDVWRDDWLAAVTE